LEGRRYWNLKWQWRELTDAVQWDWSPSKPGKLAAHLRSDSVPNTLQHDALRLAGQFDTISDEGAIYGERLVRSNYARAGYARQSGCDQAIAEVGTPEMPRDFVPILDRDFELTTDCRYHHVADHAIVEQSVSDGHVLRCCTVCEPATYWLERA
jgi:hypothetical protein